MRFRFIHAADIHLDSRLKGLSSYEAAPVEQLRGATRDRSQVFNPLTQNWTKRDADSGRFMDQKKDGEPFKGVRKEKKD